MKIKLSNHEIEIYDSVQNMGILRLQKFNKYQMIASEVGNTFHDYKNRTNQMSKFLSKGMVKEAIQELNNRMQTVYNAYHEFTPTGRALAILVKSIDGEKYLDYSPNALDEILEKLESIGFSYEHAINAINDVKKK